MQKTIIGQVGEPSFIDALEKFGTLPSPGTLFVHCGDSEKVIHIAEDLLIILGLPWSDTAVPEPLRARAGGKPRSFRKKGSTTAELTPEVIEAARTYLRSALTAAAGCQGALFEVLEGPPGAPLTTHPQALQLPIPSRVILEGLSVASLTSGGQEARRISLSDAPAGSHARLEEVLTLLPGSFSKHVLLRETAALWKSAGALERAAACWRDVAQYYIHWGANENACDAFERAIELCPIHFGAVERLMGLHLAAGRVQEAERCAEQAARGYARLNLKEHWKKILALLGPGSAGAVQQRLEAAGTENPGDPTGQAGTRGSDEPAPASGGIEDGAVATEELDDLLALDPSAPPAGHKLRWRLSKWLRRARAGCSRSSAAAGIIVFLWLAWDATSSLAVQKLKSSRDSMTPRDAVLLLRERVASYPATGHPERLSALEREIYQKAFQEDARLFQEASTSLRNGDLRGMDSKLDRFSQRTLFPLLASRAEKARTEIAEKVKRAEVLLDKASRFIRERAYKPAFQAYRDLHREYGAAALALIDSIPILIESVPAGVPIMADGKEQGVTPAWTFLSCRPKTVLSLLRPGYQKVEIQDPVQAQLAAEEHGLRVALQPDMLATSAAGGGWLVSNLPAEPTVVPMLGADGVLRGLDPHGLTVAWQTPLDAAASIGCSPLIVGQFVVVGTADGRVFAYHLMSGRLIWATKAGPNGGPAQLAEPYSGSVLVLLPGAAVLINPNSGEAWRRFEVPDRTGARFISLVDDLALFALSQGRLWGLNLRSGSPRIIYQSPLGRLLWVDYQDGSLLAAESGGRIAALSLKGGEKAWEANLGQDCLAGCRVDSFRACLGLRSGTIVCLDTRSGKVAWKQSLPGDPESLAGQPAISGYVAVQLARQKETVLAVLSAKNGALVCEYPLGAHEYCSTQILHRTFIVSSPTRGVVQMKMLGW